MAFMEGKLQPIDLLAALQARRGLQDDIESRKQRELQNKLLQEQLKAAEWQNLQAREVPTMTVPSSGLTGMPTKKFLHEMPGYISGVSPTDVFNQWNQNFRQGMASGGGGGYGGRGGMGGGEPQEQASPYSYEGPDHSVAKDSTSAAMRLAELFGRGVGGPGGGEMKNPETGMYKEFSETPISPVGKIVNASGGETITGPAVAADYISGKAGAEEVKQILKERQELPGKQADAKTAALNKAAKELASYPGFSNLPPNKQKEMIANIEKYVAEALASGRTVVDWGSKIREVK